MSAYLIYICHDVWDRKELEAYWDEQGPTYQNLSMKVLSSYQEFEVLEGEEPVLGVVIAEFPTLPGRSAMESTRAWFHSEAYTKARRHRNSGADYLGLLTDGTVTPIDQRMPPLKA